MLTITTVILFVLFSKVSIIFETTIFLWTCDNFFVDLWQFFCGRVTIFLWTCDNFFVDEWQYFRGLLYISNQKAIWFAPTKLETKAFTLANVDIRWTATILSWSDPINFVAKNIKVIDYVNIKTGFSFLTNWDFQGASTVGEIVIDGMQFTDELTDDGLYRIGPLIDIRSPFNVTISNSIFKVTNKVEEYFDVIIIQDSGVCSPDDSIVQNILFVNNTLTLDTISQNAFINVVFTFSDANKRNKNIILSNNLFVNINGPENSLVEIDYYSQGSVVITNNSFQNWSTTSYLMIVNANDFIDINNLSFDTWDVSQNGLL